MVKSPTLSTAIAAVALAISTNNAQAFQTSRSMALSPTPTKLSSPFTASQYQRKQVVTSVNIMAMSQSSGSSSRQSTSSKLLFQTASQKSRKALQKLRRSFTILLASFAFFLSSTRVIHTPPAHAASAAAAAAAATTSSSSTVSLTQKLNPFRTRSADEMVDAYVRDRLFANDVYDPVESAYREAYADATTATAGKGAGGGDYSATSSGAYPTVLAETAGAALGQQKISVSSLLSSSSSNNARGVGGASSSSSAAAGSGKNDGITAALIKASDFLQSKLKVSASVSYYLIAGGGLVSLCVVPGTLGMMYSGLQRLQIDKSEMKMYGKISDMDATSKRVTDDDDDDDDDDEE